MPLARQMHTKTQARRRHKASCQRTMPISSTPFVMSSTTVLQRSNVSAMSISVSCQCQGQQTRSRHKASRQRNVPISSTPFVMFTPPCYNVAIPVPSQCQCQCNVDLSAVSVSRSTGQEQTQSQHPAHRPRFVHLPPPPISLRLAPPRQIEAMPVPSQCQCHSV